MATSAAVNAFVRVYSDPEAAQARGQFDDRRAHYQLLWHYYENSIFETLAHWSSYKATYGLYRQTRSIYNPARRLVDFYAGIVYPGVLSDDASKLPDGTQIAIPFAEDTPPELKRAIAQVWRWSNWQTAKAIMVRYGAALGDVLVEIVDDVESGIVTNEVRWPGLVADLDLDPMGNVRAYVLEYDYTDIDDRTYTYRKEVDAQSIRTFRDDAPFAYEDVPAVIPNEYGFAPAVWVKHCDLGTDHGEPALRNTNKWDELNALASHALDQAHKVFGAPILVTGANVERLDGERPKRGSTDAQTNPYADRENLNILKAEPGGDVKTFTLDAGEALAHIDHIIAEIERDHPELVMYNQLREMSQVTGPGADRLFGDVAAYVNEARTAYDTQSAKLFQMSVAIGGWRANRGDWGQKLSRQQQPFLPFNLESWERGDLDLSILPRPLIPLSKREILELERMQVGLDNDRAGLNGQAAGIAERLRQAAGTANRQ